MNPEYMTYREALARLDGDEEKLRRLIAEGAIRPIQERRLLFSRSEVEAAAEMGQDDAVYFIDPEAALRPAFRTPDETPESPRRPWIGLLADALRPKHLPRQLLADRLAPRQDAAGPNLPVPRRFPALKIPLGGFYGRLLRRAGVAAPYAGSLYVVLKAVFAAIGALAAGWAGLLGPRFPAPAVATLAGLAAWILPDLLLGAAVRSYRRRIERELPFWLDLHATLVEGGMSFDEALARIVLQAGFLRRAIFSELREVHRRMVMGTGRAAALRDMTERLRVEGLDAVVGAIVMGEQMGAGISDTLRAQAEMVRNKVWEEAQARAYKLPVKLLFPVAVGVLPSLFLVVIGPSVLRFLSFLAGSGIPNLSR